MFTFWDILNILLVIELLLSGVLFYLVYRLFSKPIGKRLVLLAVVFMVQSIITFLSATSWREEGYGADVSIPLIIMEATIIAGITLLIDITRY